MRDARRRQLDGQRQPVQALADGRRSTGSASALGAKSGPRRRGALDEQADGVGAAPSAGAPRSAASGRESGGTRNSCSPDTPSATRLVTRTFSRGQASSRSETTGAAGRRCSKLSSTRSRRRSASKWWSRATEKSCPASRPPSAWKIAGATCSGAPTAPRETNATPSRKAPASSSATAIARRVLPTPPGPVSVSSRTSVAAEERTDRGQLALPPYQRRARRRQAGRRGIGAAHGDGNHRRWRVAGRGG